MRLASATILGPLLALSRHRLVRSKCLLLTHRTIRFLLGLARRRDPDPPTYACEPLQAAPKRRPSVPVEFDGPEVPNGPCPDIRRRAASNRCIFSMPLPLHSHTNAKGGF